MTGLALATDIFHKLLCFLYILAGYPLRGTFSMCDLYEILDNNFNYRYQPGSNNIIYMPNTSCTHAHTHNYAHTTTHRHRCPCYRWVDVRLTMTKLTPPFRLFRWRTMVGRCFIQINSRIYDAVFPVVLGVFHV